MLITCLLEYCAHYNYGTCKCAVNCVWPSLACYPLLPAHCDNCRGSNYHGGQEVGDSKHTHTIQAPHQPSLTSICPIDHLWGCREGKGMCLFFEAEASMAE